jgi:succinate dehydrogenase / fumarate reductase iron-sulfur subunit
MKVTFRIWMQDGPDDAGRFVTHEVPDIEPDMSFLEALDHVNAQRIDRGDRVIEFDHDCREGICGTCGLVIDGTPHGPLPATTTCQLHMRSFSDGTTVTVEPFRSVAFPILRDLKVDRSSLDRIAQAGGFISTNIRTAPEANSILIARDAAQAAFDAAACIGCGACVASCKNAAASLFTAAKIGHLSRLPQGEVENTQRVLHMVEAMDREGFGSCTNTEACEAACPQEISVDQIARMNGQYNWARLKNLGSKLA